MTTEHNFQVLVSHDSHCAPLHRALQFLRRLGVVRTEAKHGIPVMESLNMFR